MPLSRRYQADMVFQKKRLGGMWASDTMDDQKRSLDGNIYDQAFSNGNFFVDTYPMDRKADCGIEDYWIALRKIITELRVPERLTIDGFKDQN